MSEDIPIQQPEKKEGIDDNARKFTLSAINSDFLKQNGAIAYNLVIDWLVTDSATEKKVVWKKFDSGKIEYFSIEKVTEEEGRKTNKNKISEEEYKNLLGKSILRLEKKRLDFDFVQNGVTFALKYDEFPNGIHMLEVDAKSQEERQRFNSADFPYQLTEVTGDLRYYGYRVAETIAAPAR